LLDFGGTLDSPRHWLDRFVSHYDAAGFAIGRDELDPAFSHATAQGYRRWRELREFNLADLVTFLIEAQLGWLAENASGTIWSATSEPTRRDLARAIGLRFVEESRAGLDETAAILADLRERGYRLGIVSNFYGNLDRVLAEMGCARLIDVVIDSSAAGIFKPDAGIFMMALRALGVGPGETAMVGDSLDKDCLPARRLGMRTVWFCAPGVDYAEFAELGVAPDYVIRALGELREIEWR
jgi:putative hydrolase of the HAD superfamily